MIDFSKIALFKLSATNPESFLHLISPILINGETIISAFKTIRDGVIFTNKRIIAIDVQGITGKKKDFTTLPYSKIQAFSIETAGTFDLDSELELWFSGLGRVKFEFTGGTNVSAISKIISEFIL